MTVPALLCGHTQGVDLARGRARCTVCGSYWDLRALGRPFQYDATYPRHRGHLDPRTGFCKAASFERWLRLLGVDLTGRTVFEVGYGGGWCLQVASRLAKEVLGLEIVAEDRAHAVALGLPSSNLFTPDTLPRRLGTPVDLWVYLDSFEHLPDPSEHLAWVAANSAPEAQMLLVLPEAGSWSDRLLGRAWPHHLPDHAFHWSRAGLRQRLAQCGFVEIRGFVPTKLVSAGMLVAHLAHKTGWSMTPPPVLDRLRFWWNIGEQGLLARRR